MIVLQVTTSGFTRAIPQLGRIRNIPQAIPRATLRWGKILERDMKASARTAGIRRFTGTLYGTGIRYEQAPNGKIGRLFIRQYGVAVDSMRPHFVSVKSTRTQLLRWALQARSRAIRARAKQVAAGTLTRFGIFVKPHPFINAGWRRARPKLRPILRQELERVRRAA